MGRFNFGKNWQAFLSVVGERHISEAERALSDMVGVSLENRTFLDAGSGSGLMSLAARRLGARVHSFDYSAESVACTQTLKDRFFPNDPDWRVERGDVLDPNYLATLSKYDVVYSWGVLHHTGNMWQALQNVDDHVAENGTLFIAIYNELKWRSRMWTAIKRVYNQSPAPIRRLMEFGTLLQHWGPRTIVDFVTTGNPLKTWNAYYHNRGMSAWHDVVDWVGGYPYETAKPEQIFDFYKERGYTLERLATCGAGHGCNQFVFRRAPKVD
jgi:SAM-dependent methyltransferase